MSEQEKKKGMSIWGKLGLGCGGLIVLFIIIGVIASKDGTTTKTPTSNPTSTPTTKTEEPAKAKQWVTVTEIKGTTDKRSDVFELTGAKARMTYNFDGGDMIFGTIYIVKEGQDLMKEGGFPEVTINKAGEDSTFLSKGKGRYFLDVKGANTSGWTVKIEEER